MKKKIIRLNLGAAFSNYRGFTNVDLRKTPSVLSENLFDFRDLSRYDDGSITEIVARHSFEHVLFCESELVLREWFRVLKKGGRIHIICPDAQKIFMLYLDKNMDYKNMIFNLYGEFAQDAYWTAEQDRHGSLFDAPSMKSLAEHIGFSKFRVVGKHEKLFFDSNNKKFVSLLGGKDTDSHFELVK